MSPGRYVFAFTMIVWAINIVSARAETVQIVMDKMAFAPAETRASVGDTIEWVNNDILAHTATARNGDWEMAITAKKTVSVVLKKAGPLDYYCRYHPNMTGRIVVAPK